MNQGNPLDDSPEDTYPAKVEAIKSGKCPFCGAPLQPDPEVNEMPPGGNEKICSNPRCEDWDSMDSLKANAERASRKDNGGY